jgi:hypothetical protein
MIVRKIVDKLVMMEGGWEEEVEVVVISKGSS